MQFGKFTGADLRLFLRLIGIFKKEEKELNEDVRANAEKLLGTSCDELKDLGGYKSRVMVDRYAKYATEHLAVAAARIENGKGRNVIQLSTFYLRHKEQRASG